MLKKYILFTALTALCGATPLQAETLNVASLGALPDDGIDDTEALRKAVQF